MKIHKITDREMKIPKITIEKQYTPAETMERVKADSKEFREMYTVGDLLRAFAEQTGCNCGMNPEVVRVEASAFDAGSDCDNQTTFAFDMVLDDYRRMIKVHFYTDMSLNIDTRTVDYGMKMYKFTEYKICN